mgnify:CR=1 FL=1
MEMKKDFIPTCFYCNTEMTVDLDGFMVESIGGYSAEKQEAPGEEKDLSDKGELIEMVSAKLCSCPLCHRKERVIGEDPYWITLNKVKDLVVNEKIISTNPEIELLFKVLANRMKNNL